MACLNSSSGIYQPKFIQKPSWHGLPQQFLWDLETRIYPKAPRHGLPQYFIWDLSTRNYPKALSAWPASMVHLGFSNQNLSKSPLGMACLNYSSENSPVTKLRFGKYRRGWIEKMRLVRRSKQTERVTTFLLPLLSMSQVEPTMPSFSKIMSPFYRILLFAGDNWVGV